MFKSILAPLDGSELAERALPYAEMLARSTRGQLVLLRAVTHERIGAAKTISSLNGGAAEAGAYLADIAALAIDRELKSRIVVAKGDAASAILNAIDDLGVDTVVMSSHGRRGIGRAMRGSVADAILRRAPVPVLLAPRAAAITWWDNPPLKLLLPLDGSALSERASHMRLPLPRLFMPSSCCSVPLGMSRSSTSSCSSATLGRTPKPT